MSFNKIMTIIFDHTFYNRTNFTQFKIVPDKKTELFLRKNEIISRKVKNSWNIYTNKNSDSLWMPYDFENNKITLKMQFIVHDHDFFRSLLYSNNNMGKNCLCNKENVSELTVVPCTDTNCHLWSKQKSIEPMEWTICLNFEKQFFLSYEKKIKISFNVKKTFWQYYIFNLKKNDNAEVCTSNPDLRFNRSADEKFPGGKSAATFISSRSIQLAQIYNFQCKLKINTNGISKTLINQLPVASTSNIRYKGQKENELVSLIFISI